MFAKRPDTRRLQPMFLAVSAAGLTPIALIYGIAPEKSLPWLFGIDASGVDTRHIFKAFMGLYLALAAFWVAGAMRPDLRIAAMYSLVIFMVGLALGRVFSFLVDGLPSGLLIFYLLLEVGFGAMGWLLLKNAKATN